MKVKICGLTRYDDAARAIELGASMIGFVFAVSPRQVKLINASSIITRLGNQGLLAQVKSAAVFVNESPAVMRMVLRDAGIDFAQIHGDEGVDLCNQFDFQWYRALRIRSNEDAERSREVIAKLACPMVLADAYVQGNYGGTGIRLENETARTVGSIIRSAGKEFFLAGGITPQNVREAIDAAIPDGIDVSSGIEERPGIKSREKMEELFGELKESPRRH